MLNQIYFNLNSTIHTMHLILQKILERGYQLDQLQESSERLLESSETFRPLPWYKRCCYRAWWCENVKPEEDIIEGFKEL